MKKFLFITTLCFLGFNVFSQSMKGLKLGYYPPSETPKGAICINCGVFEGKENSVGAAIVLANLTENMEKTTLGGEPGVIYFKTDSNGKIYYLEFVLKGNNSNIFRLMDKVNNHYGTKFKITSTEFTQKEWKGNVKYTMDKYSGSFKIQKSRTNPDNDF